MKVFGKCKGCQEEVSFATQAYTRVEFAMKDGDHKTLNCKNCGTNTKFHVDELYAKHSPMALFVGLSTFLICIAITLYSYTMVSVSHRALSAMIGGNLVLPMTVYLILKKQDERRVSSFNNRKLKGRIHNIL